LHDGRVDGNAAIARVARRSLNGARDKEVPMRIALPLALVAVASCGGTQPNDTDVEVVHTPTADGVLTYVVRNGEEEKIIGSNDLRAVLENGDRLSDGKALDPKYKPIIDAFGTISVGCTATHIGNGIVLTAGHCFDAPQNGARDLACSNITVKWGVRRDKAAYMTSTCQRILEERLNGSIDYAIFRVSPVPPVKVDVDLSARPPTGRRLTIFGHPQLRPLEWSGTCTLQPGSTGGFGSSQFSHQCDTEPGSSGSTVLDDTTLRVIGIHDGGSPSWNYASYLFDTPLKNYVGTTPPPPPPPNDTTRPTVALMSPANGTSMGGNVNLDVVVDATDNVAVDDVVMQWAFTSRTVSCKSPPSQWTCMRSGSRVTFRAYVGTGDRSFSFTARDAAGNSASAGPFTINLR
jgi:V8-like Glu-specific endopeptidase